MGRGKNLDVNPYEITVLRRTMTMQEVADKLGVKVRSLYGWCKNNNVITERVTDDEIREEFEITKSVKETAYNLNLCYETVRKRLGSELIKKINESYKVEQKMKVEIEPEPIKEKSLEELYPELHEYCRINGWIK